ncbi:MAG: PIN domain-containing protein [Gaiella sp.]|nr:PIN domain-containing protein [Gaiella sp.]
MIADTGVLYASMDADDPSHPACVALLSAVPDPIRIPAPVVVELDWLGHSRSTRALDVTLEAIEAGSLDVVALTDEDYPRIRQLCLRYADLPLGFVDASVVAVCERLGETTVATLDRRHFSVVRPRHTGSFTLVP